MHNYIVTKVHTRWCIPFFPPWVKLHCSSNEVIHIYMDVVGCIKQYYVNDENWCKHRVQRRVVNAGTSLKSKKSLLPTLADDEFPFPLSWLDIIVEYSQGRKKKEMCSKSTGEIRKSNNFPKLLFCLLSLLAVSCASWWSIFTQRVSNISISSYGFL